MFCCCCSYCCCCCWILSYLSSFNFEIPFAYASPQAQIPFLMDMTMTSCRDGEGFHECTTHANAGGRRKTVVTTHQCCYGHARAEDGGVGCDKVEVRPMLETVQELEVSNLTYFLF